MVTYSVPVISLNNNRVVKDPGLTFKDFKGSHVSKQMITSKQLKNAQYVVGVKSRGT